ncbi:MAG: choice-of-anchor B family protein, partial [Planctomycetes bacterium]|nr:choice-of-anchor B family protein [Planctomycetota bacterium]
MTGGPTGRREIGPDVRRVQRGPDDSPIAAGPASGADTCAATTTVPVSVGPLGSPNTVTVLGDNSTATVQDCLALDHNDPQGWWESFSISRCADVTIDFCGTAPQRTPDWVFLYGNCPCGSFVGRSFASRLVCGDNNITMFFKSLAAGTYFLPIFSTGPNAQGAYEVHITAEECIGACCTPETGDCTEDLLEADCDGANEAWSPGMQCCEVACGGDGVTFDTSGVKLLGNIPVADFPGAQTRANEMWGYVSPSGGEYAIIGFHKGTAFVDVNDPTSPFIIGYIDGFVDTVPRDMSTYGNHAYLTAGAGFVGLQIVDLRDIDGGVVTLVNTTDLGVGYGAAHNLYINPDSGFLYLAIPNLNSGLGLTVVDLNTDPVHPAVVGTWTDVDSGVRCHDVHVASYTTGPNAGKEIAFCPAENDGLKIVDVTDKGNMFTISTLVYPNTMYAHQARLSADGRFVFLGDE